MKIKQTYSVVFRAKICRWLGWVLCLTSVGCGTMFDIPEKGIYTPIQLQKGLELIPVLLENQSTTTKNDSLVVGCRLKFAVENSEMEYGVLYSYDSVVTSTFVRERKIVGQFSIVWANSHLKTTNPLSYESDTILFSRTRGPFLYAVPFGCYPTDRTSILSGNAFKKAYTSLDEIRIQILPWKKKLSLAFEPKSLKLFNLNGRVASCYILGSKLSISLLDLGYIENPSLFTMSTQLLSPNNFSDSVKIFDIRDVHYNQPSNSMIIVVRCERINSPMSTISLVSIKIDLNSKSYKLHSIFESQTHRNNLTTYFSRIVNNQLQLAFMHYSIKEPKPYFLDYFYPTQRPRSWLGSLQTENFTYVQSLSNFPDRGKMAKIDFPIDNYNFAVSIRNEFITNSRWNDESGVFQLSLWYFPEDDGSLKRKGLKSGSSILDLAPILPSSAYGLVPTVANEVGAYLFISNQSVGYMDVRNLNDISFSFLYTGWFPGGAPNAIQSTVGIGDTCLLIVNNSELWEFDPNRLAIDFNRVGTVQLKRV